MYRIEFLHKWTNRRTKCSRIETLNREMERKSVIECRPSVDGQVDKVVQDRDPRWTDEWTKCYRIETLDNG
mgnify:CR=1 FL=1